MTVLKRLEELLPNSQYALYFLRRGDQLMSDECNNHNVCKQLRIDKQRKPNRTLTVSSLVLPFFPRLNHRKFSLLLPHNILNNAYHTFSPISFPFLYATRPFSENE